MSQGSGKRKHDTNLDKSSKEEKTAKAAKKPKHHKHPLQIVTEKFISDGWWESKELWTLKPVELYRLQGAIRGCVMGDALGVPHEFPRWNKCAYTGKCEHKFTIRVGQRFGHPVRTIAPGQYSDDTEMMLCLARSIVAMGRYDDSDVICRYIAWTQSNQPLVGSNTRALFRVTTKTKSDPTGLEHYRRQFEKLTGLTDVKHPWDASSESFQSDGSLMRCVPLGMLSNATAIQNAVKADVWCSNPSSFVLSLQMIYVWLVRKAAEGMTALDLWTRLISDILPTLRSSYLRQLIVDVNTHSKETQTHINKGWLVHGFTLSLLALKKRASDVSNVASVSGSLAISADAIVATAAAAPNSAFASSDPPIQATAHTLSSSFMRTMKWIIAEHPNSDTDTNACIVGGLIGALEGWGLMQMDGQVAANWPIIVASTASTSLTQVPRAAEYRIDDLALIESALQRMANPA